MNTVNVGVVGATGAVGEVFLRLLEERRFPVGDLRLFASDQSEGLKLKFGNQQYPVRRLQEGAFKGLDLVFFSSGDEISREWAPKAVAEGAIAVDNSAAFRMNPDFPLVVPEVNGDLIPPRGRPTIIANPNCSTIQLVVALAPLAQKFGIEAVRVASYQSVSGAGRAGIEELFSSTRLSLEGEELKESSVFPAPIAFNCVPQIGGFDENGFCSEELKIMNETRKILRLPDLYVSAFTVRVPTLNGHAEAVWVTLKRDSVGNEEIESVLRSAPGIVLGGEPGESPDYPTQRMASGRDPVFIGRLHRDKQDPRTWLMWIVADNLRKGAALNGIQIAERIFDIN